MKAGKNSPARLKKSQINIHLIYFFFKFLLEFKFIFKIIKAEGNIRSSGFYVRIHPRKIRPKETKTTGRVSPV